MSSPIPLIYRIVFTFIDPAFCLLGAVTHLLDPLTTLIGYSPNASYKGVLGGVSVPTEVTHLLDSMAGFFLTLGFLEAVLLRVKARDVAVWRVVQGSVAVLDLVMVIAALRALRNDGRLEDINAWRGDDWRLVAGNAGIGLVRVACALGVGIHHQVKGKRN